MKKTAILTLIASLIIFTSCQEPIYEAIREDVKPEEATVSGNIGTITRYTANDTEFLVLAANDGLRYKQKDKNSHGQWNTFNIPFTLHSYDFDSSSHSGEQIVSVLANSTTLYIISVIYDQTSTEGLTYPTNIRLWGRNITATGSNFNSDGEWKLIVNDNTTIFPIGIDEKGYYVTSFTTFQTNAPMVAHRAAYIRAFDYDSSVYRYYKLNGLEVPAEITINTADIVDAAPSTDASYVPFVRSAVYFKGGIKFFTSPAATTNETYDTEATHFYYTDRNNKLFFSNGTESNSIDCHSDFVISALATTADSILIGYGNMTSGSSGGGIDRATLVGGVPTGLGSFSTNAQFQITRSYIVLTLLNATPEKKETDSDLYGSITFSGSTANFDNIGLWSYYPSRGNWNRE